MFALRSRINEADVEVFLRNSPTRAMHGDGLEYIPPRSRRIIVAFGNMPPQQMCCIWPS